MTLTIGSLFSGIGGLELGLERGIGDARTVFQVEQNAYCRAVLAKHWPDALRFDDVRTVGAGNLPAVDVLCGGFPCQDVSVAGRQAGVVVGTRSGLWFEYSRIIRELRPRYVVVENVAALLTLGLDAVLGELAASGYDAEWDCLPASSVGAPHQRDRVFVLAYTNGRGQQASRPEGSRHDGTLRCGRDGAEHLQAVAVTSRSEAALANPPGDRRSERGPRHEGHNVDSTGRINVRVESRRGGASERAIPDSVRSGLEGQRQESVRVGTQQHDAGDHCGWSVEPDVGRVAHGIPLRVDRLKALGNAVVPQVAEVVGRLIAQREADSVAA